MRGNMSIISLLTGEQAKNALADWHLVTPKLLILRRLGVIFIRPDAFRLQP